MRIFLVLLLFFPLFAEAKPRARKEDCGEKFAGLPAANPAVRFAVREEFAQLSDGRRVFYRYHQGADPNKTVVVLNGLIYPDQNWNQYIERMKNEGYSVVQVFFSGHPESLRGLPAGASTAYLNQALTPERLTQEVEAVVRQAGLNNRFHLLTLSYGSVGIDYARAHPDQVRDLTLMAPLVVSSDRYNEAAQGYRAMMDASRNMASIMDPFGLFGARRNVDLLEAQAYQRTVESMLENGIRAGRVPQGVSVENYRSGVVSLAMGARQFDLKEYATANLPRVNLLVASREEGPALADQLRFWNLLPRDSRGALVFMDGAEHAMVGTNPDATARITNEIFRGAMPAGQGLRLNVESGARGAYLPE